MTAPILVAWCGFCCHYVPVEDAGQPCPSPHCDRTLRKRRVWLCQVCDATEHAYLARADYDADQRRHREDA